MIPRAACSEMICSFNPAGAVIFRNPALYRNVDVVGSLTAALYTTGLVTLRASARFNGSICGGRLIVEDGAVVDADVNISPEGLAGAEKMQEQMATFQPGANERIVVASIAQPAPA